MASRYHHLSVHSDVITPGWGHGTFFCFGFWRVSYNLKWNPTVNFRDPKIAEWLANSWLCCNDSMQWKMCQEVMVRWPKKELPSPRYLRKKLLLNDKLFYFWISFFKSTKIVVGRFSFLFNRTADVNLSTYIFLGKVYKVSVQKELVLQ